MRVAIDTGILVVLIVLGILVYSHFIWPPEGKPVLYRSLQSPTGNWRVEIYRKRVVRIPSNEGFDVVVRAFDRAGNLLFDESIYQLDLWEDIETRYPEIYLDEQLLKLGPGHDEGESGYFILRLAELPSTRNRL